MHINTSAIPPRYFEREFGVEFTPYEMRRKNEIKKAIINKSKEITGYVRWLPAPTAFIIMPTTTTAEPYVACIIELGSLKRPAERSLIHAKGRWSYWSRGESGGMSQRFIVEAYEEMKPDIGEMKPDLTYRDYKEILFEGVFNVNATTQDFIAHSFVSSPTSLGRIGGLSFSLYNEYDRDRKAGTLQRYLMGYIPREVIASESYEITVEGLQRLSLDPFGWSYKSLDADALAPQQTSELLTRPIVDGASSNLEYSVSLFSKDRKPKSLKEPAAALADAPIVVETKVERGRGIFDPDPKVFQFMVATHVVQATLPEEIYNKSLKYIDRQLEEFISEHPLLSREAGKGMLLDLDIHGKPRSLLHLGLSDGRSLMQREITLDSVEKAMRLFRDNLDSAMVTWEDIHPEDKDYNLAGIAPEARKVLGYIIRNGASLKAAIKEHCMAEMSEAAFDRTWKSVYNGGLIYHKGNDVYEVIPYLRDLRQ